MKKIPTKFSSVFSDAMKKYEEKKIEYGESWKDMSTNELRSRLDDEIAEWGFSARKDTEYSELLDIVNCALMLGANLKEKK